MKRLLKVFMIFFLALVLCTGIAAADLADGLVGYWPLDGNGDDVVGDSEGELVGGAEWTNDGRLNGGVRLDGATGYVAISGFTELITTEITCVAWLNGWRESAWAGIVASRGTTTFWMGFTDQDTLSYVWNNDSEQTWGWKQGPKIPQNEWAMVAMTINADEAVAYIYTDSDGLQSATNGIGHIEQTVTDNLKFGYDECCGANVRHVLGVLDEVMIYDRALTEDEILQLATGGLAVSSKGKLATRWGEIKLSPLLFQR